MEMVDMFDKISIYSIQSNLKKVKTEFVSAVKAYCTKLGCKKPIPDLPKPGPAKVEISKTYSFGN